MHVVLPMLLTSTFQSLCKTQLIAFYSFDWLLIGKCSVDICSTWTSYSDTMSLHQGSFLRLIFFSDKLSPHEGELDLRDFFFREHFPNWENKLFFELTLSHDHMSEEKWLTAPFMLLWINLICQQRNDWQLDLCLYESIFLFKVMLISLSFSILFM